MFKSKGFTIAFILLSLVIIGLAGVFIYFISGDDGKKVVESISQTAAAATEDEAPPVLYEDIAEEASEVAEEAAPEADAEAEAGQPAETEALSESETAGDVLQAAAAAPEATPGDYSLRAIRPEEPHIMPLIDELITDTGVLTVDRDGDAGEGILFRKNLEVGTEMKLGDVVNHGGAYDISYKVYTLYNGDPFLLYKTADEFFVTGSPGYVTFTASAPHTVPYDTGRLGLYGEAEGLGALLKIYQDDGQTLAFSIVKPNGDKMLANIIATYNANGVAEFEFHNTDGNFATGTIGFTEDANGRRKAVISFSSPVCFYEGNPISGFDLTK